MESEDTLKVGTKFVMNYKDGDIGYILEVEFYYPEISMIAKIPSLMLSRNFLELSRLSDYNL